MLSKLDIPGTNQQTTGEEKKYLTKTEEVVQKEEKDQMIGTEYAENRGYRTETMTDVDKVVSYITQIPQLSHV